MLKVANRPKLKEKLVLSGWDHRSRGGRRCDVHSAVVDPFEFHKRSQLFIGRHNETLSVVAMRVCNPDCSPVGING
jgi:hypothetical protein